jgi:hypothetical protein
MGVPSLAALLVLVALAQGPGALAGEEPEGPGGPPGVREAIARGVAFLVKAQNADGSWGTPATNLWDIYAPPPGSQHAFQVASSALCLSALLEVAADDPALRETIDRATEFLVGKHTISRRVSVDTLYNVWAHAYALEAFARLLAREEDPARRARFTKAAEEAIDLLTRFRFAEGGWGYYDFDLGAKSPGPGSTSFTTGTVLVAFDMAKAQGVSVPERLIPQATTMLKSLWKPDNAFAYSYDHRFHPMGGINKVKGSLARTPPCLMALDAWGVTVRPERFEKSLVDLETYGHFLRIARKYPIPHETWYQNSGYFCFYGYYYAARILERLEPASREKHAAEIAGHLVPLQEEDGSWWDYQLFTYHKFYGTGLVLMALADCLP